MSTVMNKINNAMEALTKVFEKPQQPKTQFKLRDLAFFVQFIKPVWKLGLLSIILMVGISAIKSIIPLSSKILIDYVILKEGYEGIDSTLSSLGLGEYAPEVTGFLSSLNYVVFGLLIVGVVYGLLQMVQGYLTMRYQQELTFNLQTGLFDHVLRYPISFFKDKQTGYLMSRISGDVNTLQYFFSSAITQTMSNTLYLLFSVAILVTLNTALVLVIICVLPVYLIVNYYFSGRVRALSYRQMESAAELSKDMQEVLSGVAVVKAYTTEEKEVKKVSGKIREVIKTKINTTILSNCSNSISQGIQFMLLLVIMWMGAGQIQSGAMTVGDYTAFIAYITLLTGSINSLFSTYLTLQPMFASMGRLKEMFSIVPEYERKSSLQLVKPDEVVGNIKFENVTFAYNENVPIIKNVSFEARAGEVIALVGPSGVGKTTLIDLILKFNIPRSGAIYLDDHDLRDLDTLWLRKQIGVVSQDIFLFNDTIENNIKYGNASATIEEVAEAAKKAHIHADIEKLPNGYNTKVGERGVKLSAGQRQRVSIARAFLKNMPILILDEPTSSLDVETEQHLKDSLKELTKGKTTFIISHRLTLIENTDRTIILKDGQIFQAGTYTELEDQAGPDRKIAVSPLTV
jgi:ABC-type multidrug transport system fused ATPase/permease subunit